MSALLIGLYILCAGLVVVACVIGLRNFAERFRRTFWPPETPGEAPRYAERFTRIGGTSLHFPMRGHVVVTEAGITFAICPLFYRLPSVFPTQIFIPHEDARFSLGDRHGRRVLEVVLMNEPKPVVWWFETKDSRSMMHALMPPTA